MDTICGQCEPKRQEDLARKLYQYQKPKIPFPQKNPHSLDCFSMLSVTKQMKISPLLPDTFPDTSAVPQL